MKIVKPFIDQYISTLKSIGVRYIPVFFDRWDIPCGHDDLSMYLKSKLFQSDFTTSFLSPGYVSSPWCAFEWWESENLCELDPSDAKPLKHHILPVRWKEYELTDPSSGIFSRYPGIDICDQLGSDPPDYGAALEIAVRETIGFLDGLYGKFYP